MSWDEENCLFSFLLNAGAKPGVQRLVREEQKTATILGRLALFKRGGFISIPPRCQVCIHDTFRSPSPSPLPHIHQSCNPVVFAERIRMCPWQRMKEKSTGIRFQCNCLLNCGLQLLKFYPWFCVTTAVMNSVWL